MAITIVSDKLEKERVNELQEKANKLVNEHNYSAHAIQCDFGLHENVSVSVVCASEEGFVLNCNPVPKVKMSTTLECCSRKEDEIDSP